MAKQAPSTLGDILSKVMGEHGLGRGGLMAKLLSVWDGTVGTGIAKHALPESIKGGRLTVIVDSPVWMHQLSMMAPGLVEKINSVMGAGTVEDIKFRSGKLERHDASPAKKEKFIPKRRKLLPQEHKDIEESLASISDKDLREKARRLLESSCTTEKAK
jgi:hypothetical protein